MGGVPFDLDRLATTGPEQVVLQGVEVNQIGGRLALSVSGDGRSGGVVMAKRRIWGEPRMEAPSVAVQVLAERVRAAKQKVCPIVELY